MPKRPHRDMHRLDHHVESLRLVRSESREDDARKVLDEVFDKRTLLTIYKFMTSGLIDQVDFPISTGKEGNVFRVTTKEGKHLAMKVYRVSNSTFHNIARYIEGDPRFKGIKGSHRKIILAWAAKEFKNLSRLHQAGVRVPEPIDFKENILFMEYLGTEEMPAPSIRSVVLEDPQAVYDELLKFLKVMYRKAGLVHGDLSEYNILMHDDKPYIIDCGQAMLVEHANSKELLIRDISNLNRFFRSLDVKLKREEEILRSVIGVKK